jgi:hypothetical protein
MLLTTETIITERPVEDEVVNGGHGGHGHAH